MDLFHSLHDAVSSPSQIFLHGSYVLLIISMAMRNISLLRLLAIASGLTSMIYRLSFDYDPVTVLWQGLLVLVNLVQLVILWMERFRPRLSEDAEYFIEHVLPRLHRSSARRLVKVGTIEVATPETFLIREGTTVDRLMFVFDGKARIEREGQRIATCGRGDFFGEMSYVTGEAASADVVADTALRYFSFERVALRRVLRTDNELRNALEASFNRNLVTKLVNSNQKERSLADRLTD